LKNRLLEEIARFDLGVVFLFHQARLKQWEEIDAKRPAARGA